MSHRTRALGRWFGACFIVLTAAFVAAAPSAYAGTVFSDAFDGHPLGVSLHGALPDIGTDTYTLLGQGTVVIAHLDGDAVADLKGVLFNESLLQFGPSMGAERTIRIELPGAAAGIPVVIPQVLTGTETSAVGLPAIWPVDFDWQYLNTAFAGYVNGMTTPQMLNIAALYPSCNREIPFQMEVRWKVRSPTTATMDVRVWNEGLPPAFAEGATVTYVLGEGSWPANSRSALTGVGARALVSAVRLDTVSDGYSGMISGADPAISYSGRWATVSGIGMERHTALAGQRFRFFATANELTFYVRGTGNEGSAPPLNVRIDNGPWRRVEMASPEDQMIPAYDASAGPGTHLVEVMVAASSPALAWSTHQSRFMLRSVHFTTPGSVAPAPYPSRKVLFLGDSITSGYHILARPLNTGIYGKDDARLAAPALVADLLGVDAINVSVPGIGFLRSAGPMKALQVFENTLQGVPWTPTEHPEAVIINLGTNDVDGTAESLQTAVTTYLQAVRAKLPDARIFMLRPFNGNRAETLRAGFDAAADHNSVWVDTTGWLNLAQHADTTDTVHPNTSGALKYAQRMSDLLRVYFATFPTAEISLPAPNAEVNGPVTVTGRASGYNFIGYRVEVARSDAPATWTLLKEASEPVYSGSLATWDATGLPAGSYLLRLTVIANGRIGTAIAPVSVPGRPGDLDGDNAVTLADAVAALRISGGLSAVSPQGRSVADLSPAEAPDGQIDLLDAMAILQLALASP